MIKKKVKERLHILMGILMKEILKMVYLMEKE